jgi:hypothetical protein
MSSTKQVERQYNRVFERQGGLCFYCERPMINLKTLTQSSRRMYRDNAATWDHVVPRKLGGTNGLSNRVLACGLCNKRKGSKHLDDFLSSVQSQQRAALEAFTSLSGADSYRVRPGAGEFSFAVTAGHLGGSSGQCCSAHLTFSVSTHPHLGC